MGPFVPEFISEQLNLIVALVLGLGFGFVLEQAGFSSSRKLAGVFYGYDFTVLRVFFTAAVTAMSGTILLGYFGLLDLEAIYINPTWLWPAVIGGVIMGVGFVLGGYCPGTSICAMAIGKVDAMFFVGGGIVGVFFFGELYPLYQTFYESSALGPITVFNSLGISAGLFALVLIVVAVGAFAVTTLIERKTSSTAPSISFKKLPHRIAGVSTIVLGMVLVALPNRKDHLIGTVSSPAYLAQNPVSMMEPDELAFRILDKEPNILIVDIRSAEDFKNLRLPGSNNIQTAGFFAKEQVPLFSQRHVKKVIVGATESDEQAACLLLHELGYENTAILKGAFPQIKATILDKAEYAPTGSRWDADVREFRATAHLEINKMILAEQNVVPKAPKAGKKIAGGC